MGVEKKIVWTDIETSHLDKETGWLLEIYCRVTDAELNTLDEFQAVVLEPEEFLNGTLSFEEWLSKWDPWSQKNHTENGLVNDLLKAVPRAGFSTDVVEEQLIQFLKKHHGGKPKSIHFGGSSFGVFDHEWLEEKMPAVLSHAHYRCIDVSSTRVQMEMITGEDWEYPKKKGHRGKEDIDDTIAEYKYLWQKFADWLVENRIERGLGPYGVVAADDIFEKPSA